MRRLFAVAAEITVTAHEAATAGQSGALSAGDYAEAARRLRGVARGIAALAEAAAVIADPERRRFLGQPRSNALKGLDLHRAASLDGW